MRRSRPLSETPPHEEGARAFEEDFVDLFENAPCGYLSADPSGRIGQVNQTLANWIGCTKQEIAGRRFQDLLNIAGKIYYETHFSPLLRMQGFFHEVALDLVGREGRTVPVLVNAVERRDEAGDVQFLRITVFNAADRRRYERELLEARRRADEATAELQTLNQTLEERVAEAVAQRMQAEEALRQSQKMEAVGQLTGGVAHDFNNLLTVILGGLESIGRQVSTLPPGAAVERIQRSAAMAAHAGERAATLTARLLAFSRRQPLDPKPLDIARLVTGLADMLQRTLGETIALETVTGAGLWRTIVDPAELENALVNLAVNARDSMPSGGRLTIETTNAFLDEDYVATIAEPVAAGPYVLLAVTDTGQGMDAETLTRVFEPFFTTKAVGKGTGLGLSQVYGFLRQSGGHIRIYSEVGVGTTVKLYLPRLVGDVPIAPAPVTAPTAAAAQGGSETILVVEDHDDLRTYSTEVLTDLGYRVIAVGDGRQALQLLATGEPVDLLFTDVVLPEGLDGRSLADQAQVGRPDLKVLFTTGYTRNAIVHNDKLDAGVELISKPFTAEALGTRVRTLLDR
ncbi:MAG: hybrid sensor histidine kinase/response regulator [Phenylobacterium sp.]|nr:hybrid sensor histidine kinase/response regulator [Phenylobacterium sp.]